MPSITKLILVALVCLSAAACSNKLEGKITVDGKAFELKSCRSGAVYGFTGVELSSKNSGKLRVAATPTGQGSAFYMPAGSKKGVALGPCGTFEVSRQSSEINGVKNVKGKANLDCTLGGHTVKGNVKFSNCH